MNFLTETERQQLKLQHRRERDGRIRDRIKAILLYMEVDEREGDLQHVLRTF